MYLIPSFIVIPVVLLVLYFFNRQHDKKVAENINKIVQPIEKDALFDVPTVKRPNKQTTQTPTKSTRSKLTPEQRLANEEKIKKLKASLKRIQDNKLNLKKVQKKDKIDDNSI
jgi:hypothetical protein